MWNVLNLCEHTLQFMEAKKDMILSINLNNYSYLKDLVSMGSEFRCYTVKEPRKSSRWSAWYAAKVAVSYASREMYCTSFQLSLLPSRPSVFRTSPLRSLALLVCRHRVFQMWFFLLVSLSRAAARHGSDGGIFCMQWTVWAYVAPNSSS